MTIVYWGRDKNFGDILTNDLLKYCEVEFKHVEDFKKANTFVIGSIARLAKEGNHVYGSGVYRYTDNINPKANFHFVRGPLTREKIISQGGSCPEIYGDAALLLPRFCEESKKEYEVGLTPNYITIRAGTGRLKRKHPDFKIINPNNNNPLNVAKEITKCKKIISGSLHGIICAHAYGIPAAYAPMGKIYGDDIKFKDYFKSVGLEAIKSTIENPVYTDIKKQPDLDLIEEILRSINQGDTNVNG